MSDILRLKYNQQTKPVLADRDGEAIDNWVDTGNHVIAADSDHAYAGSKSFKLSSVGIGSASEVIVASYSESNNNSVLAFTKAVGQGFRGNGYSITKCKFYAFKVGSPTGNCYAKLYAASGMDGVSTKPTGSALATSDAVLASSFPSSLGLVEFTFSTTYPMGVNGHYCIVLEYDGFVVDNYISIGLDNSPEVGIDNISEYDPEVPEWTFAAGYALNFYVYGKNSVGDFTSHYASLASGDNATFTIGQEYCINIFAYATTGITFQLKTGGVTSEEYTCVAGVFTTFPFVFTAATATTAFQIILTSLAESEMWFEISPLYKSAELPVLMEKGLTRAEKFSMYPQIVNEALDGSKETQYMAFIRSLDLRTNALTDAQVLSYLYWCLDNSRLVDYDIGGIQETDLILIPEPEQSFDRYDDCKLTPYLEISLSEGIARTAFPS